jgi:hypothetical protein
VQIRAMLLAAAFNGQKVNVGQARKLIQQGNQVLGAAAVLAAGGQH